MVATIFEQWIGQTLKQYQIISLLNEDQNGPVFKAHDLTLQRDVALRILPTALAEQPNFRESFLQTARTAARLDHPNLLKVLDFGWDRSMPYLVTEYFVIFALFAPW